MRYLISALFGLAFGSFANVCIARLPKDASIGSPRSRCPRCRHPLRIIDNIPILSFLALKGRCHFCRAPISWQYPLVEAAMALAFVFHAAWFATPERVLIADILSFYLLTLSIIDYRHHIIPDELSLSLAAVGVALSYMNPFPGGGWGGVIESLAAGFTGGAGMFLLAWLGEKIFKKEALGGGDIKLMAALGALLGWPGLVGSIFFGSLFGGMTGGALLLLGKKKRGEMLPFGPFLSLGAFLACLFPDRWLPLIFP